MFEGCWWRCRECQICGRLPGDLPHAMPGGIVGGGAGWSCLPNASPDPVPWQQPPSAACLAPKPPCGVWAMLTDRVGEPTLTDLVGELVRGEELLESQGRLVWPISWLASLLLLSGRCLSCSAAGAGRVGATVSRVLDPLLSCWPERGCVECRPMVTDGVHRTEQSLVVLCCSLWLLPVAAGRVLSCPPLPPGSTADQNPPPQLTGSRRAAHRCPGPPFPAAASSPAPGCRRVEEGPGGAR